MIRDKLFRKVTGISDENVIVELEKMASVQSLRKGEMYIHRGEPEMQVAFLLSGGIKTFLIQDNGSMYVNCPDSAGVPSFAAQLYSGHCSYRH